LSNTSAQKLTLTSKNNASVTLDINTYSKSLQQFLKQATKINVKEQRPFSYLDYPNLKQGNFRQIVHKFGDNIERVGKGHPRFYKLKGVTLPA